MTKQEVHPVERCLKNYFEIIQIIQALNDIGLTTEQELHLVEKLDLAMEEASIAIPKLRQYQTEIRRRTSEFS